MKNRLFVDTNFFCAINNPTDALAKKATSLTLQLQDFLLVTSNFILLETYTILSQRISKDEALLFGNNLARKKNYEVIWIDKEFENKVWEIFVSIKDKDFSYIDASILAVMQKEKIKHLLSFDRGFMPLEKQFSFTLIGP